MRRSSCVEVHHRDAGRMRELDVLTRPGDYARPLIEGQLPVLPLSNNLGSWDRGNSEEHSLMGIQSIETCRELGDRRDPLHRRVAFHECRRGARLELPLIVQRESFRERLSVAGGDHGE